MVNDAGRYHKQNGDILLARNSLLNGWIFEGLPAPPDADFTLSYDSNGQRGSLSEWKQRLFWVSVA